MLFLYDFFCWDRGRHSVHHGCGDRVDEVERRSLVPGSGYGVQGLWGTGAIGLGVGVGAIGHRLQATGYRLQATGYRLQATGYRL